MRQTILRGVEDDIAVDLGGDAMIVAAVSKVATGGDYLVREATLTGEEVVKILAKAQRPIVLDEEIVADHHYVLRAYDD